MQFLKQKFNDVNNCIDHFISQGNTLKDLEHDSSISEVLKENFVKTFAEKLIRNEIFTPSAMSCLPEANPWSIDFPSWFGPFNEQKGKKVFVIGAEPHIHSKYLQTVYHLNNERAADYYLSDAHPLFKFLTEIISARLNVSQHEALEECYLTDLFPMSPFRGEGLAVGTAEGIQAAIGKEHNWYTIRAKYARENLRSEIEAVKPKMIITQGVSVLEEVIPILGIETNMVAKVVKQLSGRSHYIRRVDYNGIPIISVPHIGSGRTRTFWKKNIDQIKEVFTAI